MGASERKTVKHLKTAKMKIVSCLLVAVMMVGYCEAQFGSFTATQSCSGGSNCNQNNFGRKRRQILEEILSEVEAEESAREIAAMREAEEIARDVAKREAEAEAPLGGFIATQNCVGSTCNQNNFGRKKRQIAEMIESLTKEVMEEENSEEEEAHVEREKREAEAEPQFGSFIASQNCVGSSCNQNNFGRKKREVIAALLEELL